MRHRLPACLLAACGVLLLGLMVNSPRAALAPAEPAPWAVPLPILATPVGDRTSLADPTAEASSAAALAAPLPRRAAPAPYVRLALPDPYENRRPLCLPVTDEDPTPVAAAPTPPRP